MHQQPPAGAPPPPAGAALGMIIGGAGLVGSMIRNSFWSWATLPMISPTIFFNLVLSVIATFQSFTSAFVATNGGPLDSTLFLVLYIYRQAFEFFHMGYAAALAWVLFLIILVVTHLKVPVIGMQTFGLWDTPWLFQTMDRLWHMLLPSVLGASGGIAVLSRYVRSQMLEVEGQDYVRTAKAKGLPWEMVHYKHALRNALLPFVTMFGLILPGLIGGSVIIESIFSWPGLGRMAYEAILARDYPVILTINFIAAVLVLIGTFVSDILYVIVDPRIRL